MTRLSASEFSFHSVRPHRHRRNPGKSETTSRPWWTPRGSFS